MTATETSSLPTYTFSVNWSDLYRRNGHSAKAVSALKDAGYKFDGDSKTWTGEGVTADMRHYIGRGILVDVNA